MANEVLLPLAERLAMPDMVDLPDWAAADALNRPDPALPPVVTLERTLIGPGSIMAALGADAGAAFLDSLQAAAQTVSRLRWAMVLIMSDGIDVAHPQTRQELDTMTVAGLLTADQAQSLKALAERTRFISWAEHNGVEVTARTVGLARGAKE